MPKPFQGHIGTIQRNAIANWMHAAPGAQVLLFGDEPGVAEVAATTNAHHIRRIRTTSHGAPLLDDVFHEADRLAVYDTLCFVNADIFFRGDVVGAIAIAAKTRQFLMIGESTDMDVGYPLRFDEANWRLTLPRNESPRGPLALDFFFFPRGLFAEVPPFAMGRARYDNWLVSQAVAKGAAVIDCTRRLDAVHQHHDYAHLPGGRREAYRGPDALRNQALAGVWCYLHLHSVVDAPFVLDHDGLSRRSRRYTFVRQLWLRFLGLVTPQRSTAPIAPRTDDGRHEHHA